MAAHEDLSRIEGIHASSDRTFGLIFGAFFIGIGLWPLAKSLPQRNWALILGGAFCCLALLAPALLRPLNKLWVVLGTFLNKVTNPIVTGVIFFGTVLPTALVLRLAGRDPLRVAFDEEAGSYWIERRPEGPGPDTMTNQF